MVNDVSGGLADADMLPVVGALGVPYVCMHMRGTPQNMQQLTEYDDVVTDVLDYFISRIGRCRAAGIKDVVADVGIGFSKTIAQNFTLLRHLDTFHLLDVPLLIGVSRKSLIYKSLNIRPEEALNGTTVLHTIALQNGAHILRTHDVKEALETIELFRMVRQPEPHMAL
jgi:dihydropteroate synthase